MRTPIYSFDTSEIMMRRLRQRVSQGDKAAKFVLQGLSQQYRRDLRVGRQERPFTIA